MEQSQPSQMEHHFGHAAGEKDPHCRMSDRAIGQRIDEPRRLAIDGDPILASYPDYRFRAPNLILLRGAIEHALPKLPLGVYFSADAAKSPLARGDIDFNNLRTTYSVGLTVHAGGLPLVYLLFAWGGNEGTHTTFSISNTLLGASPRPSMF